MSFQPFQPNEHSTVTQLGSTVELQNMNKRMDEWMNGWIKINSPRYTGISEMNYGVKVPPFFLPRPLQTGLPVELTILRDD